MMMIHNLLDLIRRARTLWFMVHGSILLYRNYVHITCTSLSNHALRFVITYCYESLVHCVSLAFRVIGTDCTVEVWIDEEGEWEVGRDNNEWKVPSYLTIRIWRMRYSSIRFAIHIRTCTF